MEQLAVADDGIGERVDAVVERAIAERRIVGAVLMVSVSGRSIYERAAGAADREHGRATRLDTIFRWASLTKPVVAATTLALEESGVVSLDDPVTKHLPDFRPRLPNGETPTVTVRHLLTHTAGLTYGFLEADDGPYHRAGISDGRDIPGRSIDDNLARINSVPLSYPPGSAWGYSVALDVLGEFIARAARTPLPQLVRDLVTGPLGMSDSGFTVADRERLAAPYGDGSPEPERMRDHHVVPFGLAKISFAPDRMFDPASFPSGGSGMSGTAADFLRLLETLRAGGAPILSPRSVNLLATIATGDLRTLYPGFGFSLGWSVLADPSRTGTPQSPGTWAWGGVYGNSWFVDPAKGLSVVVLTNTAVAGMTGAFPNAVRDAIYASLRTR